MNQDMKHDEPLNTLNEEALKIIKEETQSLLSDHLQLDMDAKTNLQSDFTDSNSSREIFLMTSSSKFLDNYKHSLLKSTDIAEKYHQNEIESIRKMMTNVLGFMWFFGIASVVMTVIFAFFQNIPGVVATPALGSLLEIVAGFVMKLLDGTLRSKDYFFKQDMEMQKMDKILGLILTVSENSKKNDLIEKIVNDYINSLNNNNNNNND